MKSAAKATFNYTIQQLGSFLFRIRNKTAPEHFTRSSYLGFENTAILILNLIKKSAKVELMDFFYHFDKELKIPSRQAFSQAREKISYLAFKDLFEKTCEITIIGEGARTYKGYRLYAVDGTTFAVGDFDKLSVYFGETTALEDKAMCRISAVVDILNECIADAEVSPFCVGERALAISQTKKLKDVSNALYIFDRGYWSPELVSGIIQNNQKFLMRLASSAGKAVVTDADGTTYPGCRDEQRSGFCSATSPLRRYSFVLLSGVTEVLLTNIPETEMSDDELAALYAKRWGAETKYLELKDRLQIDKFSGESVNVVLQDIYATLYISNLVAFICFESDEEIKARVADKGNMYEQKTNRSTCISTIRKRFIDIALMNDTDMRNAALDRLCADISRDVIYIGKSKSRPRNKRHIKAARSMSFKALL